MQIRSLHLKNFRNYPEERFVFGPEVNLICGPNARGKTTILEALHLLMTGRSFRSQHLKELIRHKCSDFFIEVSFAKFGVEQTLRMTYDGVEKGMFYNRTPCKTPAGLIGVIPGTIMVPDDVSIVKGPPALRRRYLDILLAQSDPLYVHHLMRYQRALRQRNILLREKKTEALEIWEAELAKSAGYIAEKRYSVLVNLQAECCSVMSTLSEMREEISLKYKCQCPENEEGKAEFYIHLFRKMRNKELHFGTTLAGPHKDDVQILIGEKEARQFASEGQQRSLVSALRFAEWQTLRNFSECPPVMLIDDLGISLDIRRRAKLRELLSGLNQVFITTTEKEDLYSSKGSPCLIELE